MRNDGCANAYTCDDADEGQRMVESRACANGQRIVYHITGEREREREREGESMPFRRVGIALCSDRAGLSPSTSTRR